MGARGLVTVVLALVLAGCGGGVAVISTAVVVRGDVVRTATSAGALSGVAPGGGVAVVAFPETDVAMVHSAAPVRLSFAAVPGLRRDGVVQAVAPDAVTISGVTEYYVTIVLLDGDPRLRAGQTVQASVTTASRPDVLMVPNGAVVRIGAQSFVDTPDRGRVRFTPGVVGDHTTEVLGGLSEGQRVLPQGGQ